MLIERKKARSIGKDYWDRIITEAKNSGYQDLWRASMKGVLQKLTDRWLEGREGGIVLKTDLYDEAVSPYGLMPLFSQKYERTIGTDLSHEVALAARKRMTAEKIGRSYAVVTDARNLAFRSGSFNLVLSHSTLDHFNDREDIITSLKEIFRVLKPDGLLIITLDNPSNPIIFLRNLLPYRLLRSLGIIPYFMGVTLCRSELIRILESIGFNVSDSTAIGHSPRILLIWLGHVLNWIGSGRMNNLFFRLSGMIEYLERLPMRFLTGYFVAVRAVKR
jgi:SAM-dependent methyltransferase